MTVYPFALHFRTLTVRIARENAPPPCVVIPSRFIGTSIDSQLPCNFFDMSLFSDEEKNLILMYGSDNSLGVFSPDDEDKWQELGQEIGRDWKEVREAYRQWMLKADVLAAENNRFVEEEKIDENDEEYAKENLSYLDLGAQIEVNNEESKDCVQAIDVFGELMEIKDFQQYLINDTDILSNVNFQNESVTTVRKRKLNFNELDTELLKILIRQSKEELELRKQEHVQKMKIYEMHLEHGRELHQEKLEILRTKLRAMQHRVNHIDHAISNKNLHKRFKSGPI